MSSLAFTLLCTCFLWTNITWAKSSHYQVAQNSEEDLFDDAFFEEESEDFSFDDENFEETQSANENFSNNETSEDEFSFESVEDENFSQDSQVKDAPQGINEASMNNDINNMGGTTRPKETDRFYYIKHPNQKKGLYKISSDGTYYYKVDESPRHYGIAVKGGAFLFNELKNPRTGTEFKEVYGTSAKPGFFIEYLWPFFKDKDVAPLIRAMRLKIGTGFLYANGTGQFSDPVYSDVTAPESYSFFAFPLQLGLQYAFEFYDKQLILPYVTGAFDYLVGFEVQDGDFGTVKLLGQLGAHAAAGGALSLDWLESSSSFELDKEFGINQTYLTIEFRQNIAIQTDFDFTSTSLTAGLWLEF